MKSFIIAGIAMLLVGAILGLVLAIASKKFYVEEDPRVEQVSKLLPGYNCGACGHSGCAGLATALVSGETDVILCKPIKQDKKEEIINYMSNTPGPDGQTRTLKSM